VPVYSMPPEASDVSTPLHVYAVLLSRHKVQEQEQGQQNKGQCQVEI